MKWTSSRVMVGGALVATLIAAWFAPDPQTGELALSDKARAASTRGHDGTTSGINGAINGAINGGPPTGAGSASATVSSNTRSGAVAIASNAQDTSRMGAAEPVQVLALRPRDGQAVEGPAEAGWLGVARARPVPAPVRPVIETPPPLPAGPAAAPALPFRAFGRYVDGGEDVVFLMMNDQNLAVRVGDTIAEHYRVERLEGQTLTLRYLPLDLVQTLDVGGKN
ncbi:hypothetical protein OU995_17900 [Roseateles sp. SL47]|uniref:hypothetical protein n=1 Tax=Roseateles sp. SL47 TaxID=2995138 RepID=UPI00227127E4|nr:hypothetical protein [Roseateles sp. SL47]WAC71448.1 hypothetical protein OU995_17900 [Roseateles sp. SL47]